MVRCISLVAALSALLAGSAPGVPVAGQDIADIDYAHLSFRGFAPEFGYVWPGKVEPTPTYGIRLDLGYAGPGLRVVPSLTYWTSTFEQSEIVSFSNRVAQLVAEQTGGPPPDLDLGTIDYSDLVFGLDAHVVWALPLDLLTFGGLGFAAHVIDGDGSAINGTFVEDLFDSVEPGFNLHVGAEYPVTERMRVYSSGRYELMPDQQLFQIRFGWQFMTGPNAPGEGPGDG